MNTIHIILIKDLIKDQSSWMRSSQDERTLLRDPDYEFSKILANRAGQKNISIRPYIVFSESSTVL